MIQIVEHMTVNTKLFEEFSLTRRIDVCTQPNNVDCGPFIMKYMEEPSLMASKKFLVNLSICFHKIVSVNGFFSLI